MSLDIFYVYVHKRIGSGVPFYVGKGHGNRAYRNDGRNQHWKNVVAKDCGRNIEFVVTGIDEEFAFLVEIEAIDKYRRYGIKLANLTDGGEGPKGHVVSEETRRKLSNRVISESGRKKLSESLNGHPVSQETRAKIAASLLGRKASAEARHNISMAHKGKRAPLSETHKAQLSVAHKGAVFSEEHRAKIGAGNKGKLISVEHRLKTSLALTGYKHTEEARANMVEARRRREQARVPT